MNDLGGTLLRLLAAKNVSQNKLAAWVEVDHSYISRICAGQRHPSRDICAAIIRALKLNREQASDLLHAAGYIADGEHEALLALRNDDTVATVIRILSDPAIPDDWKQHFRHSIEDLAASSRFVRVRKTEAA